MAVEVVGAAGGLVRLLRPAQLVRQLPGALARLHVEVEGLAGGCGIDRLRKRDVCYYTEMMYFV